MKLLALGVLLSAYSSTGFAATLVSFYAKDQHGSIAGATDANGNLTTGILNQYNDYGVNQSNASSQGKISISYDPYQYSGEYTDQESGLQPLGNGYRYYDPSLMRFISPDSYPLLNLYAYVNGNPIMNVDPTGHMPVLDALGVAAGVMTDMVGAVTDQPELDVVGTEEIEAGVAAVEAEETQVITVNPYRSSITPPTTTLKLDGLPCDVIHEVTGYLGPRDISSLQQVNSQLLDNINPQLLTRARLADQVSTRLANTNNWEGLFSKINDFFSSNAGGDLNSRMGGIDLSERPVPQAVQNMIKDNLRSIFPEYEVRNPNAIEASAHNELNFVLAQRPNGSYWTRRLFIRMEVDGGLAQTEYNLNIVRALNDQYASEARQVLSMQRSFFRLPFLGLRQFFSL